MGNVCYELRNNAPCNRRMNNCVLSNFLHVHFLYENGKPRNWRFDNPKAMSVSLIKSQNRDFHIQAGNTMRTIQSISNLPPTNNPNANFRISTDSIQLFFNSWKNLTDNSIFSFFLEFQALLIIYFDVSIILSEWVHQFKIRATITFATQINYEYFLSL